MKAKKIIVSLLIASPLILGACSEGDKNTSGRYGNGGAGTPLPGGSPRSPQLKPSAFFDALRQSEDSLALKYWFTSRIDGANITYSDLSKTNSRGLTTFQEISRRDGISVRDAKINFYDDIYAFAKNFETLNSRKAELKLYDSDSYEDFLAKTFSLGNIFIGKRAQLYTRLLEVREQQLENIGIQEINVIQKGVLDISVVGVDHSLILRKSLDTVLNTIRESKKTCDALTKMLNDKNFKANLTGLEIRDCASSPVALRVSQLNTANGISVEAIASSINRLTIVQLEKLNSVGDSYLAANSIVLSPNSQSGIDLNVRRNWERTILRDKAQVSLRTIEIALENNLFENLIFKNDVLEALLLVTPRLTHNQQAIFDGQLAAASRALRRLRHQKLNFKVGSSAVSNGIAYQEQVGVLTAPEVIVDNPRGPTRTLRPRARPAAVRPSQNRPQVTPDVRTNIQPQTRPEQEPRLLNPPIEAQEPAGPPTPPTSVRRRD